MRTGVYPIDRSAVPKQSMIPAEVFEDMSSQDSDCTVEGGVLVEDRLDIFEEKEKELRSVKSETKGKKPRNTVSRHVSGKELTSTKVLDAVKQHQISQKKPQVCTTSVAIKKCKNKVKPVSKVRPSVSSPLPGPSHINLAVDSSSTDNDSDDDTEKCCVCGLFQPRELADCVSLTFVKWAECDGMRNGQPCRHWTHLCFCSPVRVIRRGDKFFCPHCVEE